MTKQMTKNITFTFEVWRAETKPRLSSFVLEAKFRTRDIAKLFILFNFGIYS